MESIPFQGGKKMKAEQGACVQRPHEKVVPMPELGCPKEPDVGAASQGRKIEYGRSGGTFRIIDGMTC